MVVRSCYHSYDYRPNCSVICLNCYSSLSGQAMSGAGGGGFIFVLTKEPNMVDEVKAVIKKMKVESCFCASIAHVKFTNILFQFPIGL